MVREAAGLACDCEAVTGKPPSLWAGAALESRLERRVDPIGTVAADSGRRALPSPRTERRDACPACCPSSSRIGPNVLDRWAEAGASVPARVRLTPVAAGCNRAAATVDTPAWSRGMALEDRLATGAKDNVPVVG